MAKHIVRFANTTNTAGETINENDQSVFSFDRSRYNKMNVLINVLTLSGTSPTITVSVQEDFGGTFVETAKSSALGSTGARILCRDGGTTGVTSVLQSAFPPLGSGAAKRIVTTIGGTTSAVSADIYLIFFDNS